MNIYILNKLEFNEFMKSKFITNENVESYTGSFFISIMDTGFKSYFENKSNVKVLEFDDVDRDIEIPLIGGKTRIKAKAFTEEQAKELFEFIKKNKLKKTCIIHCSAGISRSGAIGQFICDYTDSDYNKFKKDNPRIHPNQHVLSLLNMAKNS